VLLSADIILYYTHAHENLQCKHISCNNPVNGALFRTNHSLPIFAHTIRYLYLISDLLWSIASSLFTYIHTKVSVPDSNHVISWNKHRRLEKTSSNLDMLRRSVVKIHLKFKVVVFTKQLEESEDGLNDQQV